MHPHYIFTRRVIIQDMRTFNYTIWAEITRALEREELIYKCPLYDVLRKWLSPNVHTCISEETRRTIWGLVVTPSHSARIAIDALKRTAIELVFSNLVEDVVNLDDSSAVCLHMLVCTSGCYGCARNLLFIRQSHAVVRPKLHQ